MVIAKYVVTCPNCYQRVMPDEHIEEQPFPFLREGGGSLPPWEYVIASCEICWQTLIIRKLIEGDGETPKKLVVEVLWPAPERPLSETIPASLRDEHAEARACFKVNAYTATVVMVRRTLEGVCSDQGIGKAPLYAALEEMRSTGLIEGRLLEWAQGLRVLGNDAAHFTGRSVSREDAEDALGLAEALLDYMYVFSAQFQKFRDRRNTLPPEQTSNGSERLSS
jgi:Domain of unknown function (DUF4145)